VLHLQPSLITLNPKRNSETGVTSLFPAAQTLGEEYTDIWQSTTSGIGVSQRSRLALILLPVLSTYVVARLNLRHPPGDSTLGKVRQSLPATLEIAGEVNLALFYLRGVYYDLVKRVLGIRYVRGARHSAPIREGFLNSGPHFAFSIHR
jgi:peroxin-10